MHGMEFVAFQYYVAIDLVSTTLYIFNIEFLAVCSEMIELWRY